MYGDAEAYADKAAGLAFLSSSRCLTMFLTLGTTVSSMCPAFRSMAGARADWGVLRQHTVER